MTSELEIIEESSCTEVGVHVEIDSVCEFVTAQTTEESLTGDDKLGKLVEECQITVLHPSETVEDSSTEQLNEPLSEFSESDLNLEVNNHKLEDADETSDSEDYKDGSVDGENYIHPKNHINSECYDSDVESYNPFKSTDLVESTIDSPKNSLMSRIGPFADNRPICECDTMKHLMSRADTRYLLSLLPDMAEMNSKQKIVFKNRVIQLVGRVLHEC